VDWLQIIVLALIQGITEFLPISSSAHLILPAQFGFWTDQGLAFDVAVHLGSLAAVCLHFRRELAGFAGSGWRTLTTARLDEEGTLLAQILMATVPLVLAGLLLKDWVEDDLRGIGVIAAATVGFGALLWLADRQRGTRERVDWPSTIGIGLAQALALIPGTSRSGITMTAALLFGLSRTSAARFSFLLSIPAISGAAALLLIDLLEAPEAVRWLELASGALLAFASAYLCIGAFLALVERTGMLPYVLYRFVLGAVLMAFWL